MHRPFKDQWGHEHTRTGNWSRGWLVCIRSISSHIGIDVLAQRPLAFTRYSFTSSRLCTSQSSFHSSGPPALPTLLQYYCTAIGQYTTPLRPPFGISYTIQYWRWQYRVKAKTPRETSRRTWWIRWNVSSKREYYIYNRLGAYTRMCYISISLHVDIDYKHV